MHITSLSNCKLCPRECGIDRFSNKAGFCASGTDCSIGSVCIHKGEEPPVSGLFGICNIFFTRCNLQCIFCQNIQISRNSNSIIDRKLSIDDIIKIVFSHLDAGCGAVGFVSPSHYIPQMIAIIEAIKASGAAPVFVMNTNAYDKYETIILLEKYIDLYLPDFKYSNNLLAKKYSKVENYCETAIKAIAEMVKQKGNNLFTNDRGYAESGVIIRHLVLPGNVDNSINALRILADRVGTSINLSLMSQYNPPLFKLDYQNLNRKLFAEEYNMVVEEAEKLGYYKGWIQELESSKNYNPDFKNDHPFL